MIVYCPRCEEPVDVETTATAPPMLPNVPVAIMLRNAGHVCDPALAQSNALSALAKIAPGGQR